MHLHDLLISIAALISEILGTLSGFGSSTFFVPIASYLEKFQFVLALTAILHCFGNTSKIFLFREHFEWKYFFRLAVPSVVLSGVGALLTNYLPGEILKTGLGVVLILLSSIFLLGKFRFKRLPDWAAIVLSGISGFATGLVGTGGAIRGIALGALNLERGSFVVLSAAIDFGGDFLRMIIYLKSGFMDWSQWFYVPILGILAFIGARIGKQLLGLIPKGKFEKMVAVFVLLGGIAMLF